VSLRLGSTALLLALILGGGLGAAAALRRNRREDYLILALATLGITVPPFVVAPLLQIFFGLDLAWLPVGGWGEWRSPILPIVTLALPQIAIIARMTRAAMLEVLRSNPVRTLRANGLPLAIILRHALRAAALPVVSYLGPAAAALLTGSVVVETIFGIPGIGRFFVEGALNRDYTLVMGTVVVVASFVLFFNLVADILYAVLDPRVRLS
jgi:oligopeptide transport system permease protein